MASTSESLGRSSSRNLDDTSNGEPTRLRRRERDASRSATVGGATDIGSLIKVSKSDIADELQSAESTTKRLEKMNKRLTEELKSALERAERMEDEMRRRDRANSDSVSKLEESSKKSKYDSDREIRELQAKLEAANSKLDDAKSEFEEKVDKLTSDYEKRISSLTSDVSDLKKKMREEPAEDPRVSALEEKLKVEKEERNKLDAEVRKLESKGRDLERAAESKERQVQELKADLEEKTKECEEAGAEKDANAKELRQLRKDAAEAEELRKQHAKLQDQTDSLKEEVKELTKKCDDLEGEKRKLEREASRGGGSSSDRSTDRSSDRNASDRTSSYSSTTLSTSDSGYTSRYSRDRTSSSSTTATGSGESTTRVGRDRERTSLLAGSDRESSRTRETSRTREASRTRYDSDSSSSSSRSGDASASSSSDVTALKTQISRMERDQERKLTEAEEKVREAELEQKRLQSLYEKEKMQREDLEKALKQDRVEGKQSVDLAIEQVTSSGKQLTEAQAEISKLAKSLQKKDRDLDDLKLKYEELVTVSSSTKNALSKTDAQGKSTERSLQTTERKLRDVETKYDKTNDKLVATTEELRATKQTLDETRVELAATIKHCDSVVKVLEEELYEETVTKEKLLKTKMELEKELQVLRWYFKPLASQKLAAPEDAENQTNEFNFAEMKRKEVENELAHLFKAAASSEGPKKPKTIADLQQSLKDGLAKLSEHTREDLSYELEDLMKYMTLAGMKTKVKLGIFVNLVENAVDAGVVRELANLTAELAEGKVHVMHAPETLLKFSLKDAAKFPDNPKAVSDALLERLAVIRSKKTGKDVSKCKIIILEGGEYDD